MGVECRVRGVTGARRGARRGGQGGGGGGMKDSGIGFKVFSSRGASWGFVVSIRHHFKWS